MLASTGINFWDLTDVANPILVKEMSLSGQGITPSDYDTGARWLTWQAPYVYLTGSSNGLIIVDASDPANPVFKKKLSKADLGYDFDRAGASWVVSSVMTISMSDNTGFATFDVSDLLNPVLQKTIKIAGAKQYGSLLNGNKLYLMAKAATTSPSSGVVTYDINNLANPTKIASLQFGSGGGYALIQDNFLFEGASSNNNGIFKVNVATNTYSLAAQGPSGTALRDPDFVGVFGNLAMISDDDGDGSILLAHQTNPDTTPPAVNMVSPKNNAPNVRTSSRVGGPPGCGSATRS